MFYAVFSRILSVNITVQTDPTFVITCSKKNIFCAAVKKITSLFPKCKSQHLNVNANP